MDYANATLPTQMKEVLLRSLDPVALLEGSMRLTGSEKDKEEAVSRSNFLCFRIVSPTDSLALGIKNILSSTLGVLSFPQEILSVFISARTLGSARYSEAIQWLSAWRFTGDLNEQIPAHAPPNTICIVRAEDVVCDLLLQPLEVLKSYIQAFVDTWSSKLPPELRRNVFPQLRAWDPSLASLEVEITRLLDFKFSAPAGILHSPDTRPSVNRTLTSHRGDCVAKFIHAGQLLLARGTSDEMPWEENVEPCIDEVWAPFPLTGPDSTDAPVVDPFYGHIYNRSTLAAAIDSGATVYGPTSDVLVTPDRESANGGFLRVPFRAIGRCIVTSRGEFERQLQRIHTATENNTTWRIDTPDHWHKQPLLFRGQTGEYPLARPNQNVEEFRELLYSDPHALEPSLVSSAERRGGRRPQLEQLWGMVVHGAAVFHGVVPRNAGEEFVFRSRLGDLVKLALAQHYGLPTPALDVTADPVIALWFALHKLGSSPSGEIIAQRIGDNDLGVVYVFDVPPGWCYSGELTDLQAARPSRQHGAFVPISWGLRRNRAARYLVGALYFRGALADQFKADLPTPETLFPSAQTDPFLRAVVTYSRSAPGSALLAELRRQVFAAA
jgi:hypothetical protein